MKSALRLFSGFFAIILIVAGGIWAYQSDAVQGNVYALVTAIQNESSQINMAALYEAATEPDMKYVSIVEGMRKEEVADRFATRLSWNEVEKESFAQMLQCAEDSDEGYLFPGGYAVPDTSTPDDVKSMMLGRFKGQEQDQIKSAMAASSISLDKALTVASLIQREAAGKRDMNLISGIIWNRVFSGMSLDIDATLQYAKGTEGNWWPQVTSGDKYIDSPYNTYHNKGLPPTPIANPGIAAILAALSPSKTECLFYLHDKYGRIHCSKTYEEHKANVNRYLK